MPENEEIELKFEYLDLIVLSHCLNVILNREKLIHQDIGRNRQT